MSKDKQGCLVGLTKLFLLDKVIDYLQKRFGFGKGLSCSGIGCGIILLIIFIVLACSTITGTDWTSLF